MECFGSTEEITFDKAQLPQPNVYGSRQSVTLQITIINQILLCSIYALDEASNKGPASNVVSVFIYEPIYLLTSTASTTTSTSTAVPSTQRVLTSEYPNFFDILPGLTSERSDVVLPALFDTSSVIVSGSGNNVMDSLKMPEIGVIQHMPKSVRTDDVQYNSKTEQKIFISDKVKSKGRESPYTEESKIQIYAMTGIVSCMLLVILFASTYVVVQKRKDRRSSPIKTQDHVTQNPLHIDNPPWNHGTMVRSNIWFDTLQKSLKNGSSFDNPMLTSFHSIVEEAEVCRSGRQSATDEFQSATEKTSLESFDSINDDDPPYENFPSSKRLGLQRSKSMQFHPAKPARRKSVISNFEGDVHMRQPSIRYQSSAARKSDNKPTIPGVRRSLTFADGSQRRKYVPHQAPLRHSNSRISEIIRQYNESQVQRSYFNQEAKANQVDINSEPLIAPPAAFPNNAEMVSTVSAGTNTDELSSADEDWILQKTLERKRSNSVGSASHKKKDSEIILDIDKAREASEMMVQNDTKTKDDHYDFPIVPPRPAIPPRAPRGTMSKRQTAFI